MNDDLPDGGEEKDARSLDEIVAEETEELYVSALDAGECHRFEDDEEARVHAVCFVSNEVGDEGWVVISASGSSWEGLQYDTSSVYDTHKEAEDHALALVSIDETDYEERMAEQEEEEEEEEGEGEGEDPSGEGA
jgi:hypothetical protein